MWRGQDGGKREIAFETVLAVDDRLASSLQSRCLRVGQPHGKPGRWPLRSTAVGE
jgi:hypothetical protein